MLQLAICMVVSVDCLICPSSIVLKSPHWVQAVYFASDYFACLRKIKHRQCIHYLIHAALIFLSTSQQITLNWWGMQDYTIQMKMRQRAGEVLLNSFVDGLFVWSGEPCFQGRSIRFQILSIFWWYHAAKTKTQFKKSLKQM